MSEQFTPPRPVHSAELVSSAFCYISYGGYMPHELKALDEAQLTAESRDATAARILADTLANELARKAWLVGKWRVEEEIREHPLEAITLRDCADELEGKA